MEQEDSHEILGSICNEPEKRRTSCSSHNIYFAEQNLKSLKRCAYRRRHSPQKHLLYFWFTVVRCAFKKQQRGFVHNGLRCTINIRAFQWNYTQLDAHVHHGRLYNHLHSHAVTSHPESWDISHLCGNEKSALEALPIPSPPPAQRRTLGPNTKVKAAGGATHGQSFKILRFFVPMSATSSSRQCNQS